MRQRRTILRGLVPHLERPHLDEFPTNECWEPLAEQLRYPVYPLPVLVDHSPDHVELPSAGCPPEDPLDVGELGRLGGGGRAGRTIALEEGLVAALRAVGSLVGV